MCFNTRFRVLGATIFSPLHFGHIPLFMLFLYVVMMLVATLLTMRTSLGQSRVCYSVGVLEALEALCLQGFCYMRKIM